jgi:hypothetical protein
MRARRSASTWAWRIRCDKGYDTRAFVGELRRMCVTPHVAAKVTTRHATYAASQKKRKLVEVAFAWVKTIAGLAKVKVRGLARVRHQFTFAMAAYHLIRMPRLLAAARRGQQARPPVRQPNHTRSIQTSKQENGSTRGPSSTAC